MTFPVTAGVPGKTLFDTLNGDLVLDLDASAANTFKVSVWTNGFDPSNTFDKNTDPGAYGTGLWITGEVVSTATAYTPKSLTISSGTFTSKAAGKMKFTADNLTWTGVTWAAGATAAAGCLVYKDNATASLRRGISYNPFGAAIPVTAGDFVISWSPTDGIAYWLY